jgi:hypothetical protein
VKKTKPQWFQELATLFKDGVPAIAVAAEAAADDDEDSFDALILNAGEDDEEESEADIENIEDDIAEEESGNAPGISTPETPQSLHVAGPAVALVMRRPEADKGEEKKENAEEWFFRFDTELKQVIRRKALDSKSCPEFAVSLEVDEDADDAAPVEAVFADGARHVCPDLTYGQYKTYCSPRAGCSSSNEELWSGEHCETHNNLSVRFRADRGTLVSLYEQKKQICQVALEWFEAIAWRQEQKQMLKLEPKVFKPNTDSSKKRGAAFMVNIAKYYANGSIQKADLYKTRDENLKADGLVKSTSMAAPKRTSPTAEAGTVADAVETAEAAVETAKAGTVAEAKGPIMKKPCAAPCAASSKALKRKKKHSRARRDLVEIQVRRHHPWL